MEKGEWLGMKEMTIKAIMISIKPKWCAKIMNGEKTIEVRKSKVLANAIQKLRRRINHEHNHKTIYGHFNG